MTDKIKRLENLAMDVERLAELEGKMGDLKGPETREGAFHKGSADAYRWLGERVKDILKK